jgi:putative hydrolase of the HAD superfamily
LVKKVILFDLGGTLVHYFSRSKFPHILRRSITEVNSYLQKEGVLIEPLGSIWERVQEEDHESKDNAVRPLESRLMRIFKLDTSIQTNECSMNMCRCFMKPIFSTGYCYEDSKPVIRELKVRGFKTGIVSNTPWGSPAVLWREEVQRLGLDGLVDETVFCRDVGWRKPAKQIFQFAVNLFDVGPQDCVFVGDNPRWDSVGPKAFGIKPIIIDRWEKTVDEEKEIKSLYALISRPQLLS